MSQAPGVQPTAHDSKVGVLHRPTSRRHACVSMDGLAWVYKNWPTIMGCFATVCIMLMLVLHSFSYLAAAARMSKARVEKWGNFSESCKGAEVLEDPIINEACRIARRAVELHPVAETMSHSTNGLLRDMMAKFVPSWKGIVAGWIILSNIQSATALAVPAKWSWSSLCRMGNFFTALFKQ